MCSPKDKTKLTIPGKYGKLQGENDKLVPIFTKSLKTLALMYLQYELIHRHISITQSAAAARCRRLGWIINMVDENAFTVLCRPEKHS